MNGTTYGTLDIGALGTCRLMELSSDKANCFENKKNVIIVVILLFLQKLSHLKQSILPRYVRKLQNEYSCLSGRDSGQRTEFIQKIGSKTAKPSNVNKMLV